LRSGQQEIYLSVPVAGSIESTFNLGGGEQCVKEIIRVSVVADPSIKKGVTFFFKKRFLELVPGIGFNLRFYSPTPRS
jgi:hypothetical protein